MKASIELTGPFANWCVNIQTGLEGWYVSIVVQETEESHIVQAMSSPKPPFTSKRDAELATAALIKSGLVSPEMIRKAGVNEVYRIMYEALPW